MTEKKFITKVTEQILNESVTFIRDWVALRLGILLDYPVEYTDKGDKVTVELQISDFGSNQILAEFLENAVIRYNLYWSSDRKNYALYNLTFGFKHKEGGRNAWIHTAGFSLTDSGWIEIGR